jgi:hypothetical protein
MNLRLEQEKPHPSAENDKAWEAVLGKLEEFRKLKDDWDGEGSPAPEGEVIDAANRLANAAGADGTTAAPDRVLAGVNGTISFEWVSKDRFRSFEVLSKDLVESTFWEKGMDKPVISRESLED